MARVATPTPAATTASRPSRTQGPAVRSRCRRASGMRIAAPYRVRTPGRVTLEADPPPPPGDVRRPRPSATSGDRRRAARRCRHDRAAQQPAQAPVPGVVVTGEPADQQPTESVPSPAKVMRIGAMVRQLLEEVRHAPLDEAGRDRMRDIYDISVRELSDSLSPDLAQELGRVARPFVGEETPSEAELRVAQAQLVGWLEGLFHGIQATLFAQQMTARNQLEEMRRRAIPGRPGLRPLRPVPVGPGRSGSRRVSGGARGPAGAGGGRGRGPRWCPSCRPPSGRGRGSRRGRSRARRRSR